MTVTVLVAATALALAAAARSTWSPCGRSMLATLTPLGERGRARSYRATVGWFVSGSTLGGATLGLCMAALALGVGSLHLQAAVLAVVALCACVVTAAADSGLSGFALPAHHRQVNERWLDQFRAWVYAGGFGWQIGTGLATFIVTPALYLMIFLAALAGNPRAAVLVGTLFGLLRGVAVLLGRGITSAQRLVEFHSWFDDLGPSVHRVMVAVELACAVLMAWRLSPWAALALAGASSVVVARWALRRPGRSTPGPMAQDRPVRRGDHARR